MHCIVVLHIAKRCVAAWGIFRWSETWTHKSPLCLSLWHPIRICAISLWLHSENCCSCYQVSVAKMLLLYFSEARKKPIPLGLWLKVLKISILCLICRDGRIKLFGKDSTQALLVSSDTVSSKLLQVWILWTLQRNFFIDMEICVISWACILWNWSLMKMFFYKFMLIYFFGLAVYGEPRPPH